MGSWEKFLWFLHPIFLSLFYKYIHFLCELCFPETSDVVLEDGSFGISFGIPFLVDVLTCIPPTLWKSQTFWQPELSPTCGRGGLPSEKTVAVWETSAELLSWQPVVEEFFWRTGDFGLMGWECWFFLWQISGRECFSSNCPEASTQFLLGGVLESEFGSVSVAGFWNWFQMFDHLFCRKSTNAVLLLLWNCCGEQFWLEIAHFKATTLQSDPWTWDAAGSSVMDLKNIESFALQEIYTADLICFCCWKCGVFSSSLSFAHSMKRILARIPVKR